jgi:TRAP-type uncharacterized transport system substrate-binding protein
MAADPDPAPATADDEQTGTLGLTRREHLVGTAVLLALVLLVAVLVVTFWQPGPPRRVVMSTGAEDGAYHAFGKRYREVLARSGVDLVLLSSAGAVENLDRLRTHKDGVSVALVQGGLAQPGDETRLVSLGAVAYEPLWIFHRDDQPFERLAQLQGRRIAAGPPGSGTRRMFEVLLEQAGLGDMGAALLPLAGLEAADALLRREIDVAMFVSAAEGPAVQRLLRAEHVALWSATRADAYVRRLPVLTRIEIPEGAVDLVRDLPPKATTLLALKASLLASEDIHPVLVDLLLDAAREVHSGGNLVRRPGEFPAADAAEYPMSDEAERYYKTGPSFLRAYLPYWSVVWIQRLLFLGLPLLVVGIPLIRTIPEVYGWLVRRRVYRWYGELSFIERAAVHGQGSRTAQLRRLDAIEARVNGLHIPPSFAGEAYTLRSHIGMVRERLLGGPATGQDPDATAAPPACATGGASKPPPSAR